MRYFLLSFLLVALSIPVIAQSQYPPVEIPGSHKRNYTSKIISGQEFELQIMLPASYAYSNKTYPVIYVLDAQWDFPLVTAIYGQQYYDGFVPEAIIVGITYGGKDDNVDSLRLRDFTPTRSKYGKSGGGDMFLTFFNNELFPFIEKEYRADGYGRTIMGSSLGGLLVLQGLFTWNSLFTNYIAASPALDWDNESIFKFEQNYYKFDEKGNKKLYLSYGSEEWNGEVFHKMDTLLAARKYRSVKVKADIIENSGHAGTKSETYTKGLQFAFERKKMDLPEETLKKYVGRYANLQNQQIELIYKDKQLYFKDGQREIALLANEERDFYTTKEFMKINFFANGLQGFKMEKFGSMMMYKKLP